jgi:hypothetical protein
LALTGASAAAELAEQSAAAFRWQPAPHIAKSTDNPLKPNHQTAAQCAPFILQS